MQHEQYLEKCINLAKRGASGTHPNPMVGALITNAQGEIIGEGFHQNYGEAHAEVNAVRDALAKGYSSFKDCSIYVSLEPCAHQGKTPACVDLILKHQFAKLIFASHDPNPLVSGKGLGKLARTEIIKPEQLDPKIVEAAQYLNRAFFKSIKRESWITAKIAITQDGRMITRADEPRWISNSNSRRDAHLMRASHQVVITGMMTVRADNPQLNVRFSAEELGIAQILQPKRIVLTRDANNSSTMDCFAASRLANDGLLRRSAPCNDIRLMNGKDLKALVTELRQEGLTKLMIEAGPTLTQAFIDAGLVDELIVYQPHSNDTDLQLSSIANIWSLEKNAADFKPSQPHDKEAKSKSVHYEIIAGNENEPDDIKVSLLFWQCI